MQPTAHDVSYSSATSLLTVDAESGDEPLAHLVVHARMAAEQEVPIFDQLFVGRECAGINEQRRLVIRDPGISRNHLEIRLDAVADRAFVIDTPAHVDRQAGRVTDRTYRFSTPNHRPPPRKLLVRALRAKNSARHVQTQGVNIFLPLLLELPDDRAAQHAVPEWHRRSMTEVGVRCSCPLNSLSCNRTNQPRNDAHHPLEVAGEGSSSRSEDSRSDTTPIVIIGMASTKNVVRSPVASVSGPASMKPNGPAA